MTEPRAREAFPCPQCRERASQVLNSRRGTGENHDARYRRRRCVACGHRFTTWERVAPDTSALVSARAR